MESSTHPSCAIPLLSGFVSGVCLLPLDRLKIRAVNYRPTAHHHGWRAYGQYLLGNHKVWQGGGVYLVQRVSDKMLVFSTYQWAYSHLEQYQWGQGSALGLVIGTLEAISLQPLDTLKVLQQTQQVSVRQAWSLLVKQGTYQAFYRGFQTTWLRNVVCAVATFEADQWVYRQLSVEPHCPKTVQQDSIACLVSVVARTLSSQCFEVIKVSQQTRLQSRFSSLVDEACYLRKQFGWSVFLRGLGVRFIGSFFSFGLGFLGYKRWIAHSVESWTSDELRVSRAVPYEPINHPQQPVQKAQRSQCHSRST